MIHMHNTNLTLNSRALIINVTYTEVDEYVYLRQPEQTHFNHLE